MKQPHAVLAAILVLSATPAVAGESLPDPFAGLQTGKKTFETACSRCHKLEVPLSKRLDRPGWESMLGAMTARGASFTPQERALMVDYLVVKSTFETKCSSCHASENALAAKRTRDQWKSVVERMAAKTPPAFSADEIRLLTAYLTLVVGSE